MFQNMPVIWAQQHPPENIGTCNVRGCIACSCRGDATAGPRSMIQDTQLSSNLISPSAIAVLVVCPLLDLVQFKQITFV